MFSVAISWGNTINFGLYANMANFCSYGHNLCKYLAIFLILVHKCIFIFSYKFFICENISGNLASMHNFKCLEIPIVHSYIGKEQLTLSKDKQKLTETLHYNIMPCVNKGGLVMDTLPPYVTRPAIINYVSTKSCWFYQLYSIITYYLLIVMQQNLY